MSAATDDVGTNAAPDPDDTLVLPTLFPRRPGLPAKRARQEREVAGGDRRGEGTKDVGRE